MRKRIKALYILTIISIFAFCGLEGWWLIQKYVTEIDGTAADMFVEIVKVADGMMTKREHKIDDGNSSFIKMSTTIKNDSTRYSGYVVIHKRIEDLDPAVYANVITELVESGREDEDIVEVIKFEDIEVVDADINAFSEALSRVRTQMATPFQPSLMKAAIDSAMNCDCIVDTMKVETGKVWKPRIHLPSSLLDPHLTVTYPYDPLQGGAVKISVKVPVQSALHDMLLTFAISLVVALLLVTCLLYQLAVIRQQRKIADLQKSYTLTMLHELKRPLASLKLMLSFLRNPKLTDDDRSDAMNNASREIDNLGAYFNKLRAITYNEASEIPVAPTSFSISKAVDDSITQQSAPRRIKKTPGEDRMIRAERQSIINVICNLLENALKYSDGEVTIYWEFTDAGGIEIKVLDNGPGISDSDKKRVFDRFYRTEKTKSAPGMGLGLAYVKQVAEAHRGSITVTDNPAGGSIFTLKIPQL